MCVCVCVYLCACELNYGREIISLAVKYCVFHFHFDVYWQWNYFYIEVVHNSPQ